MTGEYFDAPAVYEATVVVPVFDDLAVRVPEVSTAWTATAVLASPPGGSVVICGTAEAAWAATNADVPGLGELDETRVVPTVEAEWTATDAVALTDATHPVGVAEAAWTAQDVTATVGTPDIEVWDAEALWTATTPMAAVGVPDDPMRRDRPRRFADLDRVHIWPKGDYLIRAGAALSRQGIAAVPLVTTLPFLGFAIIRAPVDEDSVEVMPAGVCDLEVEGAGSNAANGRLVYALGPDRFTLAATGVVIGRVLAWRFGRRCRVYFESSPFRSL